MSLETGLVSYAALASLALAMKKHRPSPPLPLTPSADSARLLGWLLLACSAIIAVLRYGTALGIVEWIGQMCVMGGIMVLLLSWRPRMAFMLAPICLAAALIFMLG